MSLLNSSDNKSFFNKKNKKNINLRKKILALSAIASVAVLGSTYAASVTLNSGAAVEFGQGVAETSACDPSITLTPAGEFNNTSKVFALSSIAVTDIADACSGKVFRIRAYPNTGSVLSLVTGVDAVEVTYNSDGTSTALVGTPTGITITPAANSFTLNFDTSISASSTDIYRFTIESKVA